MRDISPAQRSHLRHGGDDAAELSATLGEGLILDLRTAVFDHVQRMPVAFFTRTRTGALVSRLNNDVIGAQRAFSNTLSQVVGNVVTLVLTLAVMITLSWQVTLLALALGQVISNTATVLVVIPIALSVAATLDASVQPFMMALTVVGAAALFTPIATPVNLMVMEPGGYRFGDYWRLGIPLALAYLVIAVLWVPLIWPF